MTLRVVIADDEPPARMRLRRLLADHADVEVVAECADGATTVQAIETAKPDVVLLDIQMPELDGFEVLDALAGPKQPVIIFVSAFDQYAVQAFGVRALDYVLKPVEADRLGQALAYARTRLAERSTNSYLTRIPVRSEGRVLVVDLADVDWIDAADNYVVLHVGTREYLVRDTITAFDRRLDPDRFVRVHRSTIVQIDRIAELAPGLHGDFTIRLKNGASLALSRTFRARVEERFGRKL